MSGGVVGVVHAATIGSCHVVRESPPRPRVESRPADATEVVVGAAVPPNARGLGHRRVARDVGRTVYRAALAAAGTRLYYEWLSVPP